MSTPRETQLREPPPAPDPWHWKDGATVQSPTLYLLRVNALAFDCFQLAEKDGIVVGSAFRKQVAAELGVTDKAIIHDIRRMERWWGYELLERVGDQANRLYLLTAHGQIVWGTCRAIAGSILPGGCVGWWPEVQAIAQIYLSDAYWLDLKPPAHPRGIEGDGPAMRDFLMMWDLAHHKIARDKIIDTYGYERIKNPDTQRQEEKQSLTVDYAATRIDQALGVAITRGWKWTPVGRAVENLIGNIVREWRWLLGVRADLKAARR